jgi:hypothetical protein
MERNCQNCQQPVSVLDAFCGTCGQPVSAPVPVPAKAGPADHTPVPVSAGSVPAGSVSADSGPPSSAGGGRGGAWAAGLAATGPSDGAASFLSPNATYHGLRLLYNQVPEPPYDPLFSWPVLRQFWIRGLMYGVAYLVGAVLAGIPLGLLGLVTGGVGFIIWVIGAVLTWLTLFVLYWLVPVYAMVSEWKYSVEDKGATAPISLDHIAWSVTRRKTPVDSMQIRRLNLAGGASRDYLELRRGLFTGYICSFSYGEDLYVAWTLWVRVSGLRLIVMLISRLWQTVMQRGTDLYTTLRFDYARAMREAMHNAAREGVEVAIGVLAAQGQGTVQRTQVAVADLTAAEDV